MEEDQKLMEMEMEMDIEDVDQEKLERESTSTLMRQPENLMFTIRLMPGTTMHIKIATEQRLPDEGAWCISTLLIHNGQHYTSTIHNHMVNPEVLRHLGAIDGANANNNVLQEMLMPLEMPRNPIITFIQILGNSNYQPIEITNLVDCYCSYVLTMARYIDNMFEPLIEETSDLVTLMHNTRLTSQTLQNMLRHVEHTLEAMALTDNNDNDNDVANDDNDNDNDNANHSLSVGDANAVDDNNNNIDEDVVANADDDSDSDVNNERNGLNERFVPVDGYDESPFKCDDDASPAASEVGHHHQHHQTHDSLFVMEPDFENFPEQPWSMTSSEDGNEIQIEDESWESDFEDNEAFDAYMMRHLRAHASGLISRLNAEWMNATNHSVPPPDIDWDLGSCNSLGEIDDLWSEMSCSSDELDAWQYNEDRSFETSLSRPFRRLIGEIPPQTAQQERQSWQHFVDLCDLRTEPYRLRESFYDDEPFQPLSSFGHWRPQENLATASNNIRSGNTYNESPSSGNNTCMHSFCLHPNVNESFDRDLARLRQNLNFLESDHDQDTEIESEMDNSGQWKRRDHMLKPETATNEITSEQQIVPLALYIQQTDELIAQIRARL